jgi:hypothetical protein
VVRYLTVILLAFGVACDGEQSEPPSEARIVLFAVNDPVLDAAEVEPGSVLWLSTRAGRGWISTSDGRTLGSHVPVTGGAINRTEIWPSELEPGDNALEVRLAPDSGEDAMRASIVITVSGECTRREHCPGGQCIGFRCD